ncbi:hypothetical protein [Paracoccus yeei]|uniref:hypothetical protein n=1 Tax=Paracoccus yeei TaxID=147645 RepID=UPI0012FD3F79|nr:hypothetical protein [Paracoccus yeei]
MTAGDICKSIARDVHIAKINFLKKGRLALSSVILPFSIFAYACNQGKLGRK